MSHKLISLNPDLKKLEDEGYRIEIKNGHLLIYDIPYVNSGKEVLFGTLVTPLGDLSGDKTARPSDHVIYFIGEHPCDKQGVIIRGIQHASSKKTLAVDIEVDHSFSNKPQDGYKDYYEKVVNYVRIIEGHAQSVDRAVTAKNFKVIESTDADDVFKYIDTNSSRADIQIISDKLKNLKIGIIGLGGTGSYVLDFISKTPVKEIHLFDQDDFLSHNSFRSPGAASIEELRQRPKKVHYLSEKYSSIRDGIIPHDYNIDAPRLDELSGFNFIFICIDKGEAKREIIDKLLEEKIPFIDVGVGISAIEGSLMGSARTTLASEKKNDHINNRISFSDGGNNDYDKNIQIAEINALNASLAVIKWKKIFGFYHEQGDENNSVYDITTNKIINDETNT